MPESYIPEEKIQNIRILINLYHNEVCIRVRYINQIYAVLDRNGIILPVKDPTTKKGMLYLEKYLQDNKDFALQNLIDGLKNLNSRIEGLSLQIKNYLEQNFSQEFELLKSIPGVWDVIAGYLVAEICPIDRFASKKKLRRYAGVIPIQEKSDKKTYATYLPKHASRKLLRYALVLAANCSVRQECGLKEYYKRKKKEKGNHGKAVMCVASSISDIIYSVLTSKKHYTNNQH